MPSPAQRLANWVINELPQRMINGIALEDLISPKAFYDLVILVDDKKITAHIGRQILDRLIAEGGDPIEIAREFIMIGGDDLNNIIAAAIEVNSKAAENVRAGNAKAIGPIVGYVMRETKGHADGNKVTKLIYEQIAMQKNNLLL